MKRFTTIEKEWLGYKRKLANNNMKVSLAKAPWQQGEQHDKHDEEGREGSNHEALHEKGEVARGTPCGNRRIPSTVCLHDLHFLIRRPLGRFSVSMYFVAEEKIDRPRRVPFRRKFSSRCTRRKGTI